jgi:hypothetical protein
MTSHGFSDEELDELLDERDAALARVRVLEQLLRKIACFDDAYAQDYFEETGSYSRFAEPNTVEFVREFLEIGSRR